MLPEKLPNILSVLPNEKGFWLKHFIYWYVKVKRENPDIKIVLSDVRFQNEVDL